MNIFTHNNSIKIIGILILLLPFMSKSQNYNTLTVNNLKTGNKIKPVGINKQNPKLSWKIKSNQTNVKQTAYRITAAKSREDLLNGENLTWNTGKIQSDKSHYIDYNGEIPSSGERIYWRVRIWDNDGNVSEWSKPSFWETGLLDASNWEAEWIQPRIDEDTTKPQPAQMLRKTFTLNKPVKKARLYITSHGLYQAKINGEKAGDQVFTPGWTSYNKRLQYQTYTITSQIREGKNAIGITLGDGWFRGYLRWDMKRNIYGSKLAAIAQLEVEYEDGTQETIVTDDSWKSTNEGPIRMSDIYNGEKYDARKEKTGWAKPGFDDSNWKGVKTKDISTEKLISQEGPPIKRIQKLTPKRIFEAPNGDTIVDMGQNMVGRVRLKVNGPKGTRITLRHAEVLNQEGNLYTKNLRKADQKVTYILNGDGTETYEPHFTFQGFRYIAVEGYPGELSKEDLTGIVIHSDMKHTGHFECSDSLINQLQHNIRWGLKGNFLDIPTDCPQRDERLGWTGDAQVFAPTACFIMNTASFFTKWLHDLKADQNPNGAVPHVIPQVTEGAGAAGWADAAIIVPWTVYLHYGNKQILKEQYSSMKDWIEYMQKQAGDNFLWTSGDHFGDWLAYNTTRSDYPGATTSKDLIATAYFGHSTHLLTKIAQILGNEEDAQKYKSLFQNIKNAYQDEFITPNGRVTSNTQTAYVLSLAFDLIPEAKEEKIANYLAGRVKKFGHITTGFLGTPLINETLTQHDYKKLAYMLLFRKDYPSWLYPVTQGATTIWERWDGKKPDGSFQNPGMNSFNHYAYGAIGDWLYTRVAGIRIDPENPGYKSFHIDPFPGDKLTYVKASYKSIYGKIKSHWQKKNDTFILDVTVPPNTSAKIHIPSTQAQKIKENGKAASKNDNVTVTEFSHGKTIVEVGSGKYHFTSKTK